MISDLGIKRGTKAVKRVDAAEDGGGSLFFDVNIVSGKEDGPTLLLCSGIHGDELKGIEAVRRAVFGLDPDKIEGNVIGVPVVNIDAYRSGSRNDPHDPKDMNRVFPGDPKGSITERIAESFFKRIAKDADYILDIHSAAYPEAFLSHTRVRRWDPSGRTGDLIKAFGTDLVWEYGGHSGMLQSCAIGNKIPTITVEIGPYVGMKDDGKGRGVEGIYNVMKSLDMLEGEVRVPESQIVIKDDRIRLRSRVKGIFKTGQRLGDPVWGGQTLGRIIDSQTHEKVDVATPISGFIAGIHTSDTVKKDTSLFFLLPLMRDREDQIDPGQIVKIPKLHNAVYRKNKLLERLRNNKKWGIEGL